MKRIITALPMLSVFFMICTVGLIGDAYGQAQRSTRGKLFYMTYMENIIPAEVLNLFIAGDPGTRVTISTPATNVPGYPKTIVLPPDGYYQFIQPTSAFMLSGTGYSTRGVKIEADKDISVFINNGSRATNEANLVLPVDALGKEYVVAAGGGNQFGSIYLQSEFAIVGVGPGETKIQIFTPTVARGQGGIFPPSRPVSAQYPNGLGTPHEITLSEGETYQVQSDFDLSGTVILSKTETVGGVENECKRFAVFGGARCSSVCNPIQVINSRGNEPWIPACDYIVEQMKPITSWGKEYVVVPFQERVRDYMKVYAWEDSTLIYLDDNVEPLHQITQGGEDLGVAVLNKGDFLPFYIFATNSANQRRATFIRSNRPIQVAHFCVSQSCANANIAETGDPFFVMENPIEQYLEESRFAVFKGIAGMDYYLNVSFPLQDMGQVEYRKVGDGNWSTFPLFNCYTVTTPIGYEKYGFCYQNQLSPGAYELRAPTGHVGFISGYAGFWESFGYETGAKTDPIYFDMDFIDPETNLEIPEDIRAEDDVANTSCQGKDMIFTIQDDQERFKYFIWDFGDGTGEFPVNISEDEKNDGDTVVHRYEDSGLYTVTVKGSLDLTKCKSSIVLTYEVYIPNKDYEGPDITGPEVVCPNATNRIYSIPVIPSIYGDVVWDIKGDDDTQITWQSEDGDSIRVRFGENGYNGTDTAYIELRALFNYSQNPDIKPIEGEVCWTDATTLPVLIQRFAPQVEVQGNENVCRSELTEAHYESIFVEGALQGVEFQWEITQEDGTPAVEGTHYQIVRYYDEDPDNLGLNDWAIDVNWLPASWGQTFTINTIQFYDPELGDCLDGEASSPLAVFVYPDLSDAVSLDYVTYPPAGQPDNHVLVAYQMDNVSFGGSNRVDQADVRIDRRNIEPLTGDPLQDYATIAPNTPFGNVEDESIAPLTQRYQYRLNFQDNCTDPQAYLSSVEFQTVFLQGERTEQDGTPDPSNGTFAKLTWSPLQSWAGTYTQTLYRKLDDGEWEVFKTDGEISGTQLTEDVGEDGLFQYFKLRLDLQENGQTVHSVWSNQIQIAYLKEIYGNPIITPNADGFNDELIIVNMNAHPVQGPKKIVIFNRWNQHIWSTGDYQQDWQGITESGHRVPEGSYFYVVTDRSGGEVYKGAVTVVWD